MGDARGLDHERPVHPVRLDAFAIGRTPVTWSQYRHFCEATDRHWPEWLAPGSEYQMEIGHDRYGSVYGMNRNTGYLPEIGARRYYSGCGVNLNAGYLPVVGVSWDDAVAYCGWLSECTGKRYGLPTEAQWEYACRAGTDTRWICDNEMRDLDRYAWYSANAEGRLHAVAQKLPNPWGLYDMHGNCREWCADWYAADYYKTLVGLAATAVSTGEQRGRDSRHRTGRTSGIGPTGTVVRRERLSSNHPSEPTRLRLRIPVAPSSVPAELSGAVLGAAARAPAVRHAEVTSPRTRRAVTSASA